VVEILVDHRPLETRVTARRATGVRPRWEAGYVAQLIMADVIATSLAGGAAYWLRWLRFTGGEGLHLTYIWMSVLLPVGWILSLALNRSYDTRHLFVGFDEYQRVFRAACALMAAVAIVLYAIDVPIARGYLVLAMPLGLAFVGADRFLLRHTLHTSWARGRRMHRVIAVGHPSDVGDLCTMLSRSKYHGMEVVGACLPSPSNGFHERVPVPVYGTFDSVGPAVGQARADTVVVLTCSELNGPALRRLGWSLEDEKIDLIVASALLDVAGGRTTIRPVDGLPMLHLDHAALRGPRRFVKDIFDRVAAFFLLLIFAPLLLTLAAVIRATSDGPVLFRQVRVGRDGRQFRIVKFRTMYQGSEQMLASLKGQNEHDGLLFKMRLDPRVTPIGQFLRRYSLDELPQLFNVLGGSMSLVGPRPPLPSEVANYPMDMRRRLVVKPGMTGLWQVSGRADLPWEEVMRLDLRYVENWSLSFDLVILLRTVTAVLRSSGAY
jgi:exopolysaccharide biosynthesis polyprenyl glycosylphosphotransferase